MGLGQILFLGMVIAMFVAFIVALGGAYLYVNLPELLSPRDKALNRRPAKVRAEPQGQAAKYG